VSVRGMRGYRILSPATVLRSRMLGTFMLPPKQRLAFSGSFVLSDAERLLFDAILAARDAAGLQHIELRVVGGWCRDKLLGAAPEDIDIGVRDMTGREFAQRMVKASGSASKVHTIVVNPERSKHLETAVVSFNGYRLDFSHLRTERYPENSRIPVVDFGTPREDALRRDCTVNAIFYNLATREVEDPCERGLQDLSSKVIRTPLDPTVTLMEDPLRLLRVIRFSAGLDFALEASLREAMGHPALLAALQTKVSRERMRIELDKMLLLHRDGYEAALRHLASVSGLFECILMFPGFQWSSSCLLHHDAEASVTSTAVLLAARYAALLLAQGEDCLSRFQLKDLTWSNSHRALVLRLVRSCVAIRELLRDGRSATAAELGVWVRDSGHVYVQAAYMTGAYARAPLLHRPAFIERAFMRPLVSGDEIARHFGLQSRSIGQTLEQLHAWQIDAPPQLLTHAGALSFLETHLAARCTPPT
jgi:tRNA nucleotidyltransferase/poly(A) polymerase